MSISSSSLSCLTKTIPAGLCPVVAHTPHNCSLMCDIKSTPFGGSGICILAALPSHVTPISSMSDEEPPVEVELHVLLLICVL